jgi:8-amino-7-oxononanoate synthase
MLEQSQSFRRRLIVTDSLFSMDGDVAPLVELAELAQRCNAMLMVDEAHATGVYGQHGRGLCEAQGIEDHVDIRVGTLSKALGSMGGFVAGKKSLIDWLANRARSYVFSTSPPAAWCAAAIAALDIVAGEPQRRAKLQERASDLRTQLRRHGWNVGDSESQIIPIYLGAPEPTMKLAALLQEHGLFVPGIRPPTVPEGQSLLRISLSLSHTPAMIDRLLEALNAVALAAPRR